MYCDLVSLFSRMQVLALIFWILYQGCANIASAF
jgi:hypothetical protein